MEEEEEESPNNKELETQQQVLKVLEALKQASHELQTHPTPNSSTDSAIKALLELETESDTILSTDPHLSTLSQHLTYLKTLIDSIEKSAGRRHGLRSFLSRRVSSHAISKVAGEIESEIQVRVAASLFFFFLVWSLHDSTRIVKLGVVNARVLNI